MAGDTRLDIPNNNGWFYGFLTGRFTKTPQIIPSPRHTIVIGDRLIHIGCEAHTLEEWLEHYEVIGVKHGYHMELIEEYGELLRGLKG